MSAGSTSSAPGPVSSLQHEVTDKFAALNPSDFSEWLLDRGQEVVRLACLRHARILAVDMNKIHHKTELLQAKEMLDYAKSLLHIEAVSRDVKTRIAAENNTTTANAVTHPEFLQAMKTIVYATCISFPQGQINEQINHARHLAPWNFTVKRGFCAYVACNEILLEGIPNHPVMREGAWVCICDQGLHGREFL